MSTQTPDKQLIIAIGTGRSGSVSLYHLLAEQDGAAVSHEDLPLLPWEVSEAAFRDKVESILKREGSLVGDICHSWLPYIPLLLRQYPDARVICLERPREAVVSSYVNKLRRKNKNHWTTTHGNRWQRDPRFDPAFPKYDLDSLEEAIARYWTEYHQATDSLAAAHPERIRKWQTDQVLNSVEGMAELLTFIGVPPSRQHINVGRKHNQTRSNPGKPSAWAKLRHLLTSGFGKRNG